ncbi:Magnesium transporter MRS2-A, partial [Durusdinium trenchii]
MEQGAGSRWVAAVRDAVARCGTGLEGAFRRLQYADTHDSERAIGRKELFAGLAHGFGVKVPFELRQEVFAAIDANGDGVVDFRFDFASLFEEREPGNGERKPSMLQRERLLLRELSRVARNQGCSLEAAIWRSRDKEKGHDASSFAVACQALAPGLDLAPLLQAVEQISPQPFQFEHFRKFFQPVLDQIGTTQNTSTSHNAVKKSSTKRKSKNKKKSTLKNQDVPLFGAIPSSASFVLLLDASPVMDQLMDNGLTRFRTSVEACSEMLRGEVGKRPHALHRFNIMIFGQAHKLVKWQQHSVPLDDKSCCDAIEFLHMRERAFQANTRGEEPEATGDASLPTGPQVFRCALQDIVRRDAISHIYAVVSMDRGASANSLRNLKTRKIRRLLTTRARPGAKTRPSTAALMKPDPRSSLRLSFCVIGTRPDNQSKSFSKLATFSGGELRWIGPDGLLVAGSGNNSPRSSRHVASTSNTTPRVPAKNQRSPRNCFWWNEQTSDEAMRLKHTFSEVCKAMLKQSMTLDKGFETFDTNHDGIVSIAEFLSGLRTMLGTLSFVESKADEYRIWRCLDPVEQGSIMRAPFCAFFMGTAQLLGLPFPGFDSSEVEKQAVLHLERMRAEDLPPTPARETFPEKHPIESAQGDVLSTSSSLGWLPSPEPEGEDLEGDEVNAGEVDDNEQQRVEVEATQEQESEPTANFNGLGSIKTPKRPALLLRTVPCVLDGASIGNGNLADWKTNLEWWQMYCDHQDAKARLEGLQWSLAAHRQTRGFCPAPFATAAAAACKRVESGQLDTPGLLHPRLSSYELQDGQTPFRFQLSSKLTVNQTWMSLCRRQGADASVPATFASLHSLEMNHWLQNCQSRAVRQLRASASILDPKGHSVLFGEGKAWTASIENRQLARAAALIGSRIRGLDENDTEALRVVRGVGLLPPRTKTAAPRLALNLESNVWVDVSQGSKTSKRAVRRAELFVEYCCGASDGERFVPPGETMPLSRFWGRLQCHAVSSAETRTRWNKLQVTARLLALPGFMPHSSCIKASRGMVCLGPDGQHVELNSSVVKQACPASLRFKAVHLRGGLDEGLSVFSLKKFPKRPFRSPWLQKLAEAESKVVRLQWQTHGKDQTPSMEDLWIVEVAPEWFHDGDQGWLELEACQELIRACFENGTAMQGTNYVGVTLPELRADTGLQPVRALPGTHCFTRLHLDATGCWMQACCTGSWELESHDLAPAEREQEEHCVESCPAAGEHAKMSSDLLGSEELVLTRPLLFITRREDHVLSVLLVGRDAWVEVPGIQVEMPSRELSPRTDLRSPTRLLPAKSPRKEAGKGPIRIPDGSTTEEVVMILRQVIQEAIARTSSGASLESFFDAFVELNERGAPPNDKSQRKLTRKGLELGIRRTLGMKLPWAQFDALFVHLRGQQESISKRRFVRCFRPGQHIGSTPKDQQREQLQQQSSSCDKDETSWVRETMYDLIDAMLDKGLQPSTVFPNGASVAAFARFVTSLNIGVSKTKIFKLMSLMDVENKRRVPSGSDFGSLIAVVVEERLEDLFELQEDTEVSATTKESVADHIRELESWLFDMAIDEFRERFRAEPAAVPRRVLEAVIAANQLAEEINRGSAEDDLQFVRKQHLQIINDFAQAQEASLGPRYLDMVLAQGCWGSRWFHAGNVAARHRGQLPAPFSFLLRKAGIELEIDAASLTSPPPSPAHQRRLRRVLARTESRMRRKRLESSSAVPKKEMISRPKTAQERTRNAPQTVHVDWEPLAAAKVRAIARPATASRGFRRPAPQNPGRNLVDKNNHKSEAPIGQRQAPTSDVSPLADASPNWTDLEIPALSSDDMDNYDEDDVVSSDSSSPTSEFYGAALSRRAPVNAKWVHSDVDSAANDLLRQHIRDADVKEEEKGRNTLGHAVRECKENVALDAGPVHLKAGDAYNKVHGQDDCSGPAHGPWELLRALHLRHGLEIDALSAKGKDCRCGRGHDLEEGGVIGGEGWVRVDFLAICPCHGEDDDQSGKDCNRGKRGNVRDMVEGAQLAKRKQKENGEHGEPPLAPLGEVVKERLKGFCARQNVNREIAEERHINEPKDNLLPHDAAHFEGAVPIRHGARKPGLQPMEQQPTIQTQRREHQKQEDPTPQPQHSKRVRQREHAGPKLTGLSSSSPSAPPAAAPTVPSSLPSVATAASDPTPSSSGCSSAAARSSAILAAPPQRLRVQQHLRQSRAPSPQLQHLITSRTFVMLPGAAAAAGAEPAAAGGGGGSAAAHAGGAPAEREDVDVERADMVHDDHEDHHGDHHGDHVDDHDAASGGTRRGSSEELEPGVLREARARGEGAGRSGRQSKGSGARNDGEKRRRDRLRFLKEMSKRIQDKSFSQRKSSPFFLRPDPLLMLQLNKDGSHVIREMSREDILEEARAALPEVPMDDDEDSDEEEIDDEEEEGASAGPERSPSRAMTIRQDDEDDEDEQEKNLEWTEEMDDASSMKDSEIMLERGTLLKEQLEGALQPRDTRMFDPSFSNSHDPEILVRRHAVLVSLATAKALVLHDRMFVAIPDGADELLEMILMRFKDLEAVPMTFEMKAYEAVFITACNLVEEDYREIRPVVVRAMRGVLKATSGVILERVRAAKRSIREMENKVALLRRAFTEVLNSNEDMALMRLSELRMFPERFSKSATAEWASRHEEIELLLENYLQTLDGVHLDIKEVEQDLESARAATSLRLSTAQNRLLTVDVLVSSVTAASTLGALVAGSFGMNLSSGVEEDPYWFWAVFGVIVVGAPAAIALFFAAIH